MIFDLECIRIVIGKNQIEDGHPQICRFCTPFVSKKYNYLIINTSYFLYWEVIPFYQYYVNKSLLITKLFFIDEQRNRGIFNYCLILSNKPPTCQM